MAAAGDENLAEELQCPIPNGTLLLRRIKLGGLVTQSHSFRTELARCSKSLSRLLLNGVYNFYQS